MSLQIFNRQVYPNCLIIKIIKYLINVCHWFPFLCQTHHHIRDCCKSIYDEKHGINRPNFQSNSNQSKKELLYVVAYNTHLTNKNT
jgi:hypothetical protein